jgi:large conductance mechanosensitive channel
MRRARELERMLKEFREFALKGNMLDLAIGVIIGAAFGGLVTSLVQDIFTPILAVITGGTDFTNLYWQLKGDPQTTLAAAREAGATIAYGNFITLLINFILVAFILFMIVKSINRFRRKAETKPAPPPGPTKEEVLLAEIRDAIKSRPVG